MKKKVREFRFKEADEGEQAEGVDQHGKGVALCNTGLAVYNNQVTGRIVNNQADPKFVAVKTEQSTLRPFMTYGPKHGNPVHFVEGIFGINTEETKIIIIAMGLPKLMGSMNCSFDACR